MQLFDDIKDLVFDLVEFVNLAVDAVFQFNKSVEFVRVFGRLSAVAVIVLCDGSQTVAGLVAGFNEGLNLPLYPSAAR